MDGKQVFITAVKGTILDLKASVKSGREKPINFREIREKIKAAMVKDAMKEMQ